MELEVQVNRRALGGCVLTSVAVLTASPTVLATTAPPTTETFEVSVGMTDTGSGGILWTFIEEENLGEKYGLNVELTHQSAIDALYQDFAGQTYDIVQAVPSAVLPMVSAGLPVEILFPYSPANFFMVAPQVLTIPDDLDGVRFAGPVNSGSYQLAAAMLQDAYGFDLLENSLPAANNLEAIAQVTAGTADAAIVWEPDLTVALARNEQLQIVWDPREDFKANYGGELWGTVFAYRTDAGYPAEALTRFRDMIAEATAQLQADPERADVIGQAILDTEPGIIEEAFSSGRFVLEVPDDLAQANDDIRNALNVQLPFIENIDAIPDSIFAAE